MRVDELPDPDTLVHIASTKGGRIYRNCTVIGPGESPRGDALWVWIHQSERLILDRQVHAYIPLDEIQSWEYVHAS